jgi:hypothetical protein
MKNMTIPWRQAGAIALWPTDNTQGTHYYLNINSCRHKAHNNWTVPPLPMEVIQTIHKLAVACKKPKEIVFTNKNAKSST